MTTTRRTTPLVITCLILVLTLGVLLAARGDAAGPGGDRTYSLSSFELTYPYQSGYSEQDPSRAGVTFVSEWQGGYPGTAACSITLRGPGGEEVGSASFDLSSATDGVRNPELPVPVSGPPAQGEGECKATSYSPGEGYKFGRLLAAEKQRSRPGDIKTSAMHALRFGVRWVPSTAPGMRTCHLDITLDNGEAVTHGPHNVLVSDPSSEAEFLITLPKDRSVVDAQPRCTELRSP